MILRVLAVSMIGFTLAGCVSSSGLSGDVYSASEAKQVQSVTYGTIVHTRAVQIQGGDDSNAIGAIGGAVLGERPRIADEAPAPVRPHRVAGREPIEEPGERVLVPALGRPVTGQGAGDPRRGGRVEQEHEDGRVREPLGQRITRPCTGPGRPLVAKTSQLRRGRGARIDRVDQACALS